jgi:GNAT superfamily N-acetyltransferase
MHGADVEAVIRLIRLHDSTDARFADRDLAAYAASPATVAPGGGPPDSGAVYWVARGELPGYSFDAARGFARSEQIVGVTGIFVDRRVPDVWWLGWTYIHPARQGEEIGSILVDRAEAEVGCRAGRRFLVSTGSVQKYAPARRFYERRGWGLEVCLPGYHSVREARVIYGKTLSSNHGSPPLRGTARQQAAWWRGEDTDDVSELFLAPDEATVEQLELLLAQAEALLARKRFVWVPTAGDQVAEAFDRALARHGYRYEGRLTEYWTREIASAVYGWGA